MGLDVNGNDNTPEWGWCKTDGCKEEAYPIWKSGDFPDDPDLLLCPKHIGETIGQLEHERDTLRALDDLDTALDRMSVAEIDSARARIDSDLVPQLARMLALCLVKEDGTLYNVVSWALGSAAPFGPMELLLQRTEGKNPTELRLEAEARAEAAEAEVKALRALDTLETAQMAAEMLDRAERADADAAAWIAFVGEAARQLEKGARCEEIQSDLYEAWHRAMQGNSPGAALLTELEAARAVVRATRSMPNRLMQEALDAYDVAMKARE